MKPSARIFGDSMCKVLQFCSDDRERTLLQEAGDSFGFPIMEDELMKESTEEILYQAQDLSMKCFLASRAAQRQCRADLRSWQLSEQTSAIALNKEIDVVKALQAEKISLSSSLESKKKKCVEVAKEKDDLTKKNAKLELQLTELHRLASTTEIEKKKAEDLQNLYDSKVAELNELWQTHATLSSEHETYCDEIECHVAPLCKKVHDLLDDYGLTPAPYGVKEMFIGQVFDWLSTGVSSLASPGCSFEELRVVVAARASPMRYTLCSDPLEMASLALRRMIFGSSVMPTLLGQLKHLSRRSPCFPRT
jgi:hypothetical protein